MCIIPLSHTGYIVNAYLLLLPAFPIWIAAIMIDDDPEFAGYLVTRLRYVELPAMLCQAIPINY